MYVQASSDDGRWLHTQLCKMLEADFDQRNSSSHLRSGSMITYTVVLALFRTVAHKMPSSDIIMMVIITRQSCFTSLLNFPVPDPSLVFSEFMGVIKGSAQALDRTDRCLEQHSYENLGHRAQSTFAGQQTQIYAIFKAYLGRKHEKKEYVAADRQVSNSYGECWDGVLSL